MVNLTNSNYEKLQKKICKFNNFKKHVRNILETFYTKELY